MLICLREKNFFPVTTVKTDVMCTRTRCFKGKTSLFKALLKTLCLYISCFLTSALPKCHNFIAPLFVFMPQHMIVFKHFELQSFFHSLIYGEEQLFFCRFAKKLRSSFFHLQRSFSYNHNYL